MTIMKKLPLYITILIGMLVGTGLGFWAVTGGWEHLLTEWIKPWGTIFIRLLRLVAVPLVVVSLISGITNLSDTKHLSRMGLKTLGIYLSTTVFAIVIGLVVVNLIRPGEVFPREKTAEFRSRYEQSVSEKATAAENMREDSPLQFLVDMVPENVVRSAGDNSAMLQIVLLSIAFGIAMVAVGRERADPVKKLVESLNEIILKIIGYVMKLAPLGVMALMADLIVGFAGDSDLLLALGYYALTVVIGLCVILLICYPLIIRFFTDIRLPDYVRAVLPVQMLAFTSCSSAACLPVNIEQMRRLGLPHDGQHERHELLPRHRHRFRRAGDGHRAFARSDALDRRADDRLVDRNAGHTQRRHGRADARTRLGRHTGRRNRHDYRDGPSARHADYGGERLGRCDGRMRRLAGRTIRIRRNGYFRSHEYRTIMTNLNESKRHSRSVRRLGMIASGLALALIVLWAARVLAPGRIAFVRTLGLPDSLPGYHALADSLREGLTNCRNTVALKLAALSDPARIPVSEIRPFDTEALASAIHGERIGIDGSPDWMQTLKKSLRRGFGKTNDLTLTFRKDAPDTVQCTVFLGESIMTADRFPLGRWPVFFEEIGTAVWTALDPAVALMDHYDPCPADDYMEKINRMRLYESADDAGLLNASGSSDPRSDLVSGIVCESFGYAVQDTAALSAAAVRYRRLVGSDRRLAETLGSRIDRIGTYVASLEAPGRDDAFVESFLNEQIRLPDSCRQLILVYNDRPDRVSCVFRRYEKRNGQWRETAYPLRSNVGRAGIAPYGEKREGDGRTPSGAYPMGFAFGYVRDIDLSWPFVVVSKQHYWISDPEDPLYNQMTQQTPRTDNFEYLRRDDEVYRYAAVVEYNMRPIEKYKGSAIFFHIESGFDRGTAGCISVTRRKTVEVLQWFDPQKVPYMLIVTKPQALQNPGSRSFDYH